MEPATAELQQTLIKFAKGTLRYWGRWVQVRQKTLRPDIVQLHMSLIRGIRLGIVKPWEGWVQARIEEGGKSPQGQDGPRHLPTEETGRSRP